MSAAGMRKSKIKSHFTQVRGRDVHYARAGEGPALVMLHAAPCSSKVMAPIQEIFSRDFTTFAIDLPGFGLSSSLPDDTPTTQDLADLILETVDTLGLNKIALYGRHTGAGVAVEFARRFPERCSMVLTDGFPVFTDPYSDERLAEYLKPIEPHWDGSHLLWIWFRYREQHVFWPWDRQDNEHRADTDVPSDDFIHRGAIEILQAENGYRKVYASAFRYAGLQVISDLKAPVSFGNRPGDSQYKTRKLYPPNAWTIELPRDQRTAAVLEREILLMHPADSVAAAPASAFASGPRALTVDYLDFDDNQSLLRTAGLDLPSAPLIVLHDLPGSSALHLDLIAELGRGCPTIAPDLSGQGASALGRGVVSVDLWARQVRSAVSALNYDQVNVLAIGTAAATATELALLFPGLVKTIVFQSPPAFPAAMRTELVERYPVEADPVWDGSHLTRVWHHMRDQELWWPWFDRKAATARTHKLATDPWVLTRRVRESLMQPYNYAAVWKAILQYPLLENMPLIECKTNVASVVGDLFERWVDGACGVLNEKKPVRLPEKIDARARALHAMYDEPDG